MALWLVALSAEATPIAQPALVAMSACHFGYAASKVGLAFAHDRHTMGELSQELLRRDAEGLGPRTLAICFCRCDLGA